MYILYIIIIGKETYFYYWFSVDAIYAFSKEFKWWHQVVKRIGTTNKRVCGGDWKSLPMTFYFCPLYNMTNRPYVGEILTKCCSNPAGNWLFKNVYITIQKWSCWDYLQIKRKLWYDHCDNDWAWWVDGNSKNSFKTSSLDFLYHSQLIIALCYWISMQIVLTFTIRWLHYNWYPSSAVEQNMDSNYVTVWNTGWVGVSFLKSLF